MIHRIWRFICKTFCRRMAVRSIPQKLAVFERVPFEFRVDWYQGSQEVHPADKTCSQGVHPEQPRLITSQTQRTLQK